MKRIAILLILIPIVLISVAQGNDKYTGVYSQKKRGGDMLSFLFLYLTPENTYAFAFFGGMEMGKWKAVDEYIILEPDNTKDEHFYVYARHNPGLKDISVQFDGFTNIKGLYACDDEVVMHPVFNDNPNCFNYPYTVHLKKGNHKAIHLASFAGVWRSPGSDTITAPVYTYPLDEMYNDFKIVLNERKAMDVKPMLGVFGEDGMLRLDKSEFVKNSSWEEAKEEDKNAIAMLTASLGKIPQSREFGEDVAGEWTKTEYPAIPYSKKEMRTVIFDKNYLFEARCEE